MLQLPVNPTRESHDFVKWTFVKWTVDGDNFVVGSQILEDITLTAEWLEILPTIEEVRTNKQTEFGIVN